MEESGGQIVHKHLVISENKKCIQSVRSVIIKLVLHIIHVQENHATF
jgi:hypothetical protein